MSDQITGTMTIGGVRYEFVATLADGGSPGKSSASPGKRSAPTGILPALPDYYRVQTVRLVRYGNKDGESAKGPWTRHFAKDADTGTFYSTFDTNLGAEMKKIQDRKEDVRIAYTENDRGRTFVGYPASDYVEEAPAPDVHNAEAQADQEQAEHPAAQTQVFSDEEVLPF